MSEDKESLINPWEWSAAGKYKRDYIQREAIESIWKDLRALVDHLGLQFNDEAPRFLDKTGNKK